VLGGDENVVTLLLAVFSIGIGLGALACERLSGRKVEIGLVPFGSIGMTLFAVDLWLATTGMATTELREVGRLPARPRAVARDGGPLPPRALRGLLFGPLLRGDPGALRAEPPRPHHRGEQHHERHLHDRGFPHGDRAPEGGPGLPELFLVVGLMNAAVAAYIYTLVPEFLMRFICWLLIHSVYRLDKKGLENIPEEGPPSSRATT
jgi:hypothetical protein